MEDRLYDLIFIARPATPEDEIKKVISRYRDHLHRKRRQDRKAENLGHPQAGL